MRVLKYMRKSQNVVKIIWATNYSLFKCLSILSDFNFGFHAHSFEGGKTQNGFLNIT